MEPIFNGLNVARGFVTWQDLFGHILKDMLGAQGFEVFFDRIYHPKTNSMSIPQPEDYRTMGDWYRQQMLFRSRGRERGQDPPFRGLETLFIEQTQVERQLRVPDGLDFLRPYNLMLFCPTALETLDLQRLFAYVGDYSRYRGLSGPNDLALVAAAPRMSKEIRAQIPIDELMPGVYHYQPGPHLYMIVTREVTSIPENLLWRLFSFDPPKVREALAGYQPVHPSYDEVLHVMADKLKKELRITLCQ